MKQEYFSLGHPVYELQMVIATCQFYYLLTPVTIILLNVKRNKMSNIKTKFDTFQILGKEEFSKRTNARSWGGSDHACENINKAHIL